MTQPKTYKIHVITKDSLGNKIAEYDTQIFSEVYDRLLSDADEINGVMITVKDVEMDGELGWREYYL